MWAYYQPLPELLPGMRREFPIEPGRLRWALSVFEIYIIGLNTAANLWRSAAIATLARYGMYGSALTGATAVQSDKPRNGRWGYRTLRICFTIFNTCGASRKFFFRSPSATVGTRIFNYASTGLTVQACRAHSTASLRFLTLFAVLSDGTTKSSILWSP
jgi:hypothetical protein